MTLDLAALAQTSSNAESFETAALAWLEKEVGFDAAFFLVPGRRQAATTVGFDKQAVTHLNSRHALYGNEIAAVKQSALAANGVAIDTNVFSASHVYSTRYHREVAATVGGRHSLLAYLSWAGKTFGVVMLGRARSSFSTQQVRLVESLLPALSVSRAAYGLPWAPEPLPASSVTPRRRWFGLGERSRQLASIPTSSGSLLVRDRAGFREMVVRNSSTELVWTRSSLRDPRDSGWPYIELLHLAPALAKHRSRALFVGCGGAVALHQFASTYPGIQLELVESEAAVISLARDWFNLDSIPNLKVHIRDGISFIQDAKETAWDVIVIDAFDSNDSCSEFLQPALLNALHARLSPGGAAAWNVISPLRHEPLATLVANAKRAFDRVRVLPAVDLDETYSADARRNVVVVATRAD